MGLDPVIQMRPGMETRHGLASRWRLDGRVKPGHDGNRERDLAALPAACLTLVFHVKQFSLPNAQPLEDFAEHVFDVDPAGDPF